MISRTYSGSIQGVEVATVEIEADCSDEETTTERRFSIIGLPDAAVRESRDRVRSALWMNNLAMPRGNITINLAPASLKKSGAIYDLAISLCICGYMRLFEPAALAGTMIVGELALNGDVRGVSGILPMAMHACSMGLERILVPRDNAAEASSVQGIKVYGIGSIREAVRLLQNPASIQPEAPRSGELLLSSGGAVPDFIDVKGQETAKRALTIAAAGNHNLLMIGSPGVGKSLIANRIPGIMPPLALEEALEVTKLYSIAGILPPGTGLMGTPPFRSPHHTVSDAGLMGGGTGIPRPGEITLAHRGVLFLDELPEFRRNVLESMRQPLENGCVTISRSTGAFTFPARFMLVAAMNPCPCGYYGTPGKRCRCSQLAVQSYRSRISGPLLDRIDLHIEVPPLPESVLTSKRSGVSSAELRGMVMNARNIQRRRFSGTGIPDNAGIFGTWLDKFCTLDKDAAVFLRQALAAKNLSARSYDRILRVARTIADLEDSPGISPAHLAEACQYRSLDQIQNEPGRQRW